MFLLFLQLEVWQAGGGVFIAYRQETHETTESNENLRE